MVFKISSIVPLTMIYLEVDLQYIPSIHHLEIPKIKIRHKICVSFNSHTNIYYV